MKKAPHGGRAFGTTKVRTGIVPTPPDEHHVVCRYLLKNEPGELVMLCPVPRTYDEALRSIKFRFGENVLSVYGGAPDA